MQKWLKKRGVDLAELTVGAHLLAYLIVVIVIVISIPRDYDFRTSAILLTSTLIPATLFIILDYHLLQKNCEQHTIFIWNIIKHVVLFTIITVALLNHKDEYLLIVITLYLLPVILSCITLGQRWGFLFAGSALISVYLFSSTNNLPGNQSIEIPLVLGGIFFLVAWFVGGIIKVENETTAKLTRINIEQKQAEREILEAYKRLDEIIEFLPDPVFVTDHDGAVVSWNRSIENMTNIPKNKILGKDNYEYAIPFYGVRRPCLIDLVLLCEDELKKYKNEYDVIGSNGSTIYCETYAPKVFNNKGAYLWVKASKLLNATGNVVGAIEIIRDITERKRYEEKLKYLSLHDQLTGLYNRTYFDNELERLNNCRDYPITIISADLDNLKLINDTIGHHFGDQLLKTCAEIMKSAIRDSDILCRIGGDEFVALLPNTDIDAGEKIVERIIFKTNKYNQNSKGPIFLGISLGLATATNENTALLETVKEASELMYRDKLHHGIGTTHQIINSLIAMLGERDYITEGHARRLEDLSLVMGERLNLSQKQLSDLSLLVQIHDLGKVGTPDQVLFKKGPLNDKEWEIMKQHSEKGYRIALSSKDLSEVADLILKHHEHWDGGGYPLGIKGYDIPLECRILAIVDAYDAMINDRPYRKALSKDVAIKEIIKNAGTQFDPMLVDIFISIIKNEDEEGYSTTSKGV